MKKLFTVLWIFFTAISSVTAYHMAGAHIDYKSLGNNKYEITVVAYRDCNALQVSNIPLYAGCISGSGTIQVNLTQISIKDITGLGPKCNIQSRCSGSYPQGFQEYIFRAIADFSSLNCCQVALSWEQCCMPVLNSTVNTQYNFFTAAMLDKCVATSLEWASISPQFLLQSGQDHILNFSIKDHTDGDSISYSLAPLMDGATSYISYKNSYNAQRPISFLGFPNNTLNLPGGFHLDEKRGNIYLRPGSVNETGIVVVEATIWRKVNGSMTIIGQGKKQVFMKVISSTTSVPYQSARDTYVGCQGDTSSALISFSSNNKSDSFEVSLSHNLKWASASLPGGPTSRTVLVKFLVDSIPPEGIITAFTIELKSDACPVRGRSVKTYSIKPGIKFNDSSFITKSSLCGKVKFIANNKAQGVDHTFTLTGKNGLLLVKKDSAEVTLKDTGWVKATLLVGDENHCSFYAHEDSVYISPKDLIGIAAGNDTAVCLSAAVQLWANPVNGTPPYTFDWSSGQNGQNITLTPTKHLMDYTVTVSDSNNCKARDTITVKNYHPKIAFLGTNYVCKGQPMSAEAILIDTENPTYGWVGYNNITELTDTVYAPTQYTFRIEDGGCVTTSNWNVGVSDPQIQFSRNANYCVGDVALIHAQASGGAGPYNIVWPNYQVFSPFLNITTQGLAPGWIYYSAMVTDTLKCKNTFYDSVELHPIPVLSVSPPGSICENTGVLNLTPFIAPTPGVWAGAGISQNGFDPKIAGTGQHQLDYVYTSPAGCFKDTFTTITVVPQPVANFTVDSTTALYTHTFSFSDISQNTAGNNRTWDFGDPASGTNNTSNAKNPTHVFSDTGKYTIKLWIEGGICSPDEIIKTGYITVYGKSSNISVKEIEKPLVTIYPNPANNKLFIEAGFEIISVKITDISGRKLMLPLTVSGEKAEVIVETLSAGTYFINLEENNGKIITTPFIVSR